MYAQVVVDIVHSKIDRIFSYLVPDGADIFVGSRVLVPFGRGNKAIEGYVLGFSETVDIEPNRIKPIHRVLRKTPEFTESQLALAHEIKTVYMTPLVAALRLMFPAEMRGERVQAQMRRFVKLNLNPLDFLAAKDSLITKDGKVKAPVMNDILDALETGALALTALTQRFPSAASAVSAMEKKGWVTAYSQEAKRNPMRNIEAHGKTDFVLTSAQSQAIQAITGSPDGHFLLHGVTGSGKTEVYIRCIEHCIKHGQTAIMLVPEIALTPQMIAMFSSRLGSEVALYHSQLSKGERYDEWRKINSGEAKVVIGPRSALFVPLKNVGLIVLDEEHENSYRADQHPKYRTHDIAKMRANIEGARLVFSSATPLVETYFESETGKLKRLVLPKRVLDLPLPNVYIEDMRKELREGNRTIFSGRLYDEMVQTLAAKKQAILFINRRGVSAFVMCRGCGHIVRCDDCDVSMTLHNRESHGTLICHYCGRSKPYSKICEECGKPYVKAFGIGTQQIEHAVQQMFPSARTLRMDFDTTRTKDAHADIYRKFKNGEADILIGTQLVAKGLDFENVTLVGAMAADISLHFPDYLAVEKTYALLEQVAGRAGRKGNGRVVIQTYKPEHYAIQYAAKHDYIGFYEEEIKQRMQQNYPPFGTIVRILFVGQDAKKTEDACETIKVGLRRALSDHKQDIAVFKSSPAPIKKIMAKQRYQIVMKIKNTENIETIKQKIYEELTTHHFDGVNFGIELNPPSMV